MDKKITSEDMQKAIAQEIEILVKEEKQKLIKRAMKRLKAQQHQ